MLCDQSAGVSGRQKLISHASERRLTSGFCDHFIEGVDDGWGGTFCKLVAGHQGDHSAHYPKEA